MKHEKSCGCIIIEDKKVLLMMVSLKILTEELNIKYY